jgi:regulator of nonsense transcripts 2
MESETEELTPSLLTMTSKSSVFLTVSLISYSTTRISSGAVTPSEDTADAEEDPNAPASTPSHVLTEILKRLPETTSQEMIDSIAVEFAFVNSKAARKRLVKVCV